MKLRPAAKNAIFLGGICAVSYFTVYLCRDMLSALTPQLTAANIFSLEQLGTLSSVFFITYAFGQLINGIVGDRVKSKYMVSLGLILASLCFFCVPLTAAYGAASTVLYGAVGFFLAMIYAPMTKLVAENMDPLHATRAGVAKNLGSYLGAPVAGVMAAYMAWKGAFAASSIVLFTAGVAFFISMTVLEKRGIVQYGKFQVKKEAGGGIRDLLRHGIVKWTLIAMLTGIIRTAVLFWLPTYISQHLEFPPTESSLLYTVATIVIATNAFVAVAIYEWLKQKLDLSILVFFCSSAVCFLLVYLVRQPILNLCCMVLAILASNCASSLLWCRYCPSLRDTGMVSSATGFLDFSSYMAASVSSKLFSNAVTSIGWGNLILVWLGLMCVAVVVALPWRKGQPVKR